MQDDEVRAEVADLLGQIVDLLVEYEAVRWASALAADRARVLSGDERAFAIIRYRLAAPRGLWDVRIGLGDRALNTFLDDLRARLAELTAETPEPVEPDGDGDGAERPEKEPAYGERFDPELPDREAEPVVSFAKDHPRGAIAVDDRGFWFRSTWSLLDYDERNRFRPAVRVWKPTTPVSIEEYQSLKRSCIGWWITLAALPAVVVTAGLMGAAGDAFLWVLVVCGVAMPVVAVVVGWFERRRSAVTAIFSERTGTFIRPVSRGSRLGGRTGRRS